MKYLRVKDIPITDVVTYMGGDVMGTHPGWRPTRCPFHDDRSPSASTSNEDGRFRCHDAACDVSGSVIDLAMIHLSTDSIRDAVDWLAETFGAEEPTTDPRAEELL